MVKRDLHLHLTWILSHRGQNPARRAQLIKSIRDLIKLVGVKPAYLLTSFCANGSNDKKLPLQNFGLRYSKAYNLPFCLLRKGIRGFAIVTYNLSHRIIFLLLMILPVHPSYGANPYQLGGLDYFHQKKEPDNAGKNQEFEWSDTQGANKPPKEVLALLENPTAENARAYVMWQKQRLIRIAKAQKMIEQVIRKQEE